MDLKTVKTRVLDRCAYLLCWGATLVKVEGKYPDNIFTIEVTPTVLYYEKRYGLINYRKFCNMRKKVKRHARKASGLPEYFHVGKLKGYTFLEIAKAIPWKHK